MGATSARFRFARCGRTIGVVPQEPTLFSDTLARNIAFGAPNADMKEIDFAAQVAGLAPDVAVLPRGYDTIVGERGMSLSGGQKQRVTIARLITYHPSVVVLDDALSSVDTETERSVLHNLTDSVQGRTTIVVAHRASTVRDADEIIVLDEGHIAERGTHEESDGAARNLRRAFPSPTARRGAGAVLMVHEEQPAREVNVYDSHLIRWIWQFVKPYQTAVLDFRGADAAQLGVRADAAVHRQTHHRYLPRASESRTAAMARARSSRASAPITDSS